MKIGEVAQKAGVATSTLRYYEDIGLLPSPHRESGQRVYDKSIFSQIKRIRQMQAMGFSLEETRYFLNTLSSAKRDILNQHLAKKLQETQAQIAHYQAQEASLQAGLDCDCKGIEDCKVFGV